MKSIGEVLKLSVGFLQERHIERPRPIVEALLSFVLHMKKMDLYLQYDKPLLQEELQMLRNLIKRCAQGEPVEYVVGEVEFFGCQIQVDRRVLIPRPETEILVDLIAKEVSSGVVWDICSGSGCIGIALKKKHPALQVTLSDLSNDAMAIALQNAHINQVEVECLQGDLFAPFAGRQADVIVCNPPYISAMEYETLDPSVRLFEPRLALEAGVKGIEYYEKIASLLPLYLKPEGKLYLEIGSTQADAVHAIFGQGKVLRDWANHPRFYVISHWKG